MVSRFEDFYILPDVCVSVDNTRNKLVVAVLGSGESKTVQVIDIGDLNRDHVAVCESFSNWVYDKVKESIIDGV